MDNYELFQRRVEEVACAFKEIDKKETVRVISHLDSDGICAAAVLIKALNNENMKYSISVVQQLNRKIIDELADESYGVFVFTDLGSGQINYLDKKLSGKKIFILDHHAPESKRQFDGIHQLNPHLFDIDGSREISGSGVVYLFAKALNKKNEDMAHIPVIGAIGDVQENKDGFLRLNQEILEEAVRKNKVDVQRGLRLFGVQTKPLHKVLEYSTDPYIPGVSGSESGSIQFLHDLGIKPKTEDGWKKVVNLSKDDMKKLVAGIVMKRSSEENPEDILGYVYTLLDEEEESALRDAREFSTLLNACGRLDRASIGIGTCLGDKKAKKTALANLASYKHEIVNAITWYNENKKSDDVIKGQGYIIINAQDKLLGTMIGTLASIISRSNYFGDGVFIMAMAQLMDNTTKVSLRAAGHNNNVDLREIIKEISSKVENSEAGGHANAAGCMIPTEKEDEFIEAAKEILGKRSLEEKVV